MESTEMTLCHYGVKGMKWGVRKSREKSLELNRKKLAYKRAKKDDTATPYDVRAAKREYKDAKKDFRRNAHPKVIRERGAAAVNSALFKVGSAYLADQVFFGGIGTRAVKGAVKVAGMATITAFTMARGGYDIKWYDKHGRRIG